MLDVACVTGVLFQDYINRKAHISAIYISQEMTKIAKAKYPDINIICGDVETTSFDQLFDAIMIYNTFPLFENPKRLIEIFKTYIKKQRRICIAHGMSRENLLKHH